MHRVVAVGTVHPVQAYKHIKFRETLPSEIKHVKYSCPSALKHQQAGPSLIDVFPKIRCTQQSVIVLAAKLQRLCKISGAHGTPLHKNRTYPISKSSSPHQNRSDLRRRLHQTRRSETNRPIPPRIWMYGVQ